MSKSSKAAAAAAANSSSSTSSTGGIPFVTAMACVIYHYARHELKRTTKKGQQKGKTLSEVDLDITDMDTCKNDLQKVTADGANFPGWSKFLAAASGLGLILHEGKAITINLTDVGEALVEANLTAKERLANVSIDEDGGDIVPQIMSALGRQLMSGRLVSPQRIASAMSDKTVARKLHVADIAELQEKDVLCLPAGESLGYHRKERGKIVADSGRFAFNRSLRYEFISKSGTEKFKLCDHYSAGSCPDGARCMFLHLVSFKKDAGAAAAATEKETASSTTTTAAAAAAKKTESPTAAASSSPPASPTSGTVPSTAEVIEIMIASILLRVLQYETSSDDEVPSAKVANDFQQVRTKFGAAAGNNDEISNMRWRDVVAMATKQGWIEDLKDHEGAVEVTDKGMVLTRKALGPALLRTIALGNLPSMSDFLKSLEPIIPKSTKKSSPSGPAPASGAAATGNDDDNDDYDEDGDQTDEEEEDEGADYGAEEDDDDEDLQQHRGGDDLGDAEVDYLLCRLLHRAIVKKNRGDEDLSDRKGNDPADKNSAKGGRKKDTDTNKKGGGAAAAVPKYAWIGGPDVANDFFILKETEKAEKIPAERGLNWKSVVTTAEQNLFLERRWLSPKAMELRLSDAGAARIKSRVDADTSKHIPTTQQYTLHARDFSPIFIANWQKQQKHARSSRAGGKGGSTSKDAWKQREPDGPPTTVMRVQFRSHSDAYFCPLSLNIQAGDYIVATSEHGRDIGVCCGEQRPIDKPIRKGEDEEGGTARPQESYIITGKASTEQVKSLLTKKQTAADELLALLKGLREDIIAKNKSEGGDGNKNTTSSSSSNVKTPTLDSIGKKDSYAISKLVKVQLMNFQDVELQFDKEWLCVYFFSKSFVNFTPLNKFLHHRTGCKIWMHNIERAGEILGVYWAYGPSSGGRSLMNPNVSTSGAAAAAASSSSTNAAISMPAPKGGAGGGNPSAIAVLERELQEERASNDAAHMLHSREMEDMRLALMKMRAENEDLRREVGGSGSGGGSNRSSGGGDLVQQLRLENERLRKTVREATSFADQMEAANGDLQQQLDDERVRARLRHKKEEGQVQSMESQLSKLWQENNSLMERAREAERKNEILERRMQQLIPLVKTLTTLSDQLQQ